MWSEFFWNVGFPVIVTTIFYTCILIYCMRRQFQQTKEHMAIKYQDCKHMWE